MKLKFRSKRPPTEFKFSFARRPIEKNISCRLGGGGGGGDILFSGTALGDISFKLETKIMNFMSFFSKKKNMINATQVLSIIYNTICLQFSLYQAPFHSHSY